ncbi:HAMP domain-containing sensor histidine kinase [Mesobacillus selenatarsenatis]|uniref:histidine kinase n=1 Tax=Mesobacillus selenatarsenatis (strain DSM 18680 / JCM 14380 / FERM P-15431 / SF-1) TaxID=1321606 RepID=A0A0A8X334_MESS1|nr:HAMP domain-containing protein [Mesobacillus selenatarsenatis]GAM13402.1 sensor histidine kinase [Mesobacillus selenatarsenatis SF-1]
MEKERLAKVRKFLHESLNLSSKLFGIYLILALILFLWIGSFTESLLRAHLQQQFEVQGKNQSKTIGDSVAEYLLTENVNGVNNILKEHKKANENIEYILVFDWNSRLFAHTFSGEPTKELLNAGDDENFRVVKTDKGYIWDFPAPVTEYDVGLIRVGISEDKQLSIIKTILSNILFSLVIFFLTSAIIVASLHRIITKPINDLVKGTQFLSKGNFNYRVPTKDRNDEMGTLIRSFNQMVDDLENYRVKTDELDKKRQILLEKIIDIQEEERKFIAMELHDEIGQSLTGVKLNLKSLEQEMNDERLKEQIIDLHSQVSLSLKNIHDLIVEIGPRFLEGRSIVDILERYAKDYQQRSNINISLEIDNRTKLDLSKQTKTTIFRIMQEALTNIAKYANATEVVITIENSKTHLILIIEDNGIGFDVNREFENMSSNKNMGLFSMKERASLVEGTLLIESEKGLGTTVFVRIPLKEVKSDD